MKIKFYGVRGSIPVCGPAYEQFGGSTTCICLIREKVDRIVIIDAGTGIRNLGKELVAKHYKQELINIAFTHFHWDHIQGFPFFLPAYNARNRLRILGYEGARAGLAATLAGQMESPYFPIALKQMPGNIVIEELREMHFKVGSVRVEACFSNHPGVCVGYRIFTSEGSITYLPDNELSTEITPGCNGVEPCSIEAKLTEFIKDTDVLVIDSQYDREEYRSHVGWGHGCVDDVVRLAVAGRVKRLYLFHHDPAHDDTFVTKMLAYARQLARDAGSDVEVEAAREGETVVLHGAAKVSGT